MALGKAYVVWQDCRFESGCSANDIVMSTSTDGTTWSAVQRIPTDAVGSNVDHFIPGIAVDTATSGSTAHLALTYYYYPDTNCTTANCQLDVGFVSSTDGGTTWSTVTTLTSSADEPILAGKYQHGLHGRRLHLDLLLQRHSLPPVHSSQRAQQQWTAKRSAIHHKYRPCNRWRHPYINQRRRKCSHPTPNLHRPPDCLLTQARTNRRATFMVARPWLLSPPAF